MKTSKTIRVLGDFSDCAIFDTNYEENRMKVKAYEIHNPSFSDLTLDRQIEYGINDWAVEGKSGHLYVGRTAEEAKSIAKTHNYQ